MSSVIHPDRDARIQASIGTIQNGCEDGRFEYPQGMAFDHHRGLLFVVDCGNHRVQVFCSDDGSFVSKFGEYGIQPGQFQNPFDIAIDHDHDRIFVTDNGNNRVQVWSLSEQSFLSCVGQYGSGDLEFFYPYDIAIDKHHHRLIIADSFNHRLVLLSLIDLSFLFSMGHGQAIPAMLNSPSSIAVDHDRNRIIVSDTDNNRVQVLSLIDGSSVFEFAYHHGGHLEEVCGVCVANQGQIIVAEYGNRRLHVLAPEGRHVRQLECDSYYGPLTVAFDEHRGLIAFSVENRVHVIGANQWLADTFTWRPDRHRYAPSWMKQAVSTMTMIRSLVDESAMSMIPNELLFEIFSFL